MKLYRESYDFGNRTFDVWKEAGYWTGHIEAVSGWDRSDLRAFVKTFRRFSYEKNPWLICLPRGDKAPESLRRLFRRHGGSMHIRWRDGAEVWTRR